MGSVMIMRFCPVWLQSILKWALPMCWGTAKALREVDRILSPDFAKLLAEAEKPGWKPSNTEAKWGMEWLIQLADADERDTRTMVFAEVLLILASVLTTVFSETNVLFDLMAHPELLEEVRAEIQEAGRDGWLTNAYGRLPKLDSVLRESQRLSPPTILGFRRIPKRDHTLSSGIVLPKGSYICAPTYTIQVAATENALEDDGLRSYRKRVRESGDMDTRHQFTTTEPTVLGFGHGRTACPGRYLASVALKIILSKLLTELEFRFPDDSTSRPPNTVVHDFFVAPQDARILMRRRAGAQAAF